MRAVRRARAIFAVLAAATIVTAVQRPVRARVRDAIERIACRPRDPDFAALARYRQENAALGPPAPGEARVIFLGDSITEFWPVARHFPRLAAVNRGIAGQTSVQLLARFRQDVLALRPAAVVLLAGTNDLAGRGGPVTPEDTALALSVMADLARARGVAVVVAGVPPVRGDVAGAPPLPAGLSPERIAELNRRLAAECAARGDVWVDLAAPLSDGAGLLQRELSDDGVHPNDAGYRIMAAPVDAAIREALRRAERARPAAARAEGAPR